MGQANVPYHERFALWSDALIILSLLLMPISDNTRGSANDAQPCVFGAIHLHLQVPATVSIDFILKTLIKGSRNIIRSQMT